MLPVDDNYLLYMRVDEAERALIVEAAKHAGLSLSVWMRTRLLGYATQELSLRDPRFNLDDVQPKGTSDESEM